MSVQARLYTYGENGRPVPHPRHPQFYRANGFQAQQHAAAVMPAGIPHLIEIGDVDRHLGPPAYTIIALGTSRRSRATP